MSRHSSMALSKLSDNVMVTNVPIQRTELSMFDEAFSFMREKFEMDMMRIDEALNKFSDDLTTLYANSSSTPEDWDAITNSPLIQGQGPDRLLKMQFDLSQFRPSEVNIQINNEVLHIAAAHREETTNSHVFREFARHFNLPKGTKPENVVSLMSRDGVLTVQAPLPNSIAAIETKPKVEKPEPKQTSRPSSKK